MTVTKNKNKVTVTVPGPVDPLLLPLPRPFPSPFLLPSSAASMLLLGVTPAAFPRVDTNSGSGLALISELMSIFRVCR